MNDELRVRGEEFDTTASFLESILGSEHAAVIVLDNGLHVQRWNPAAEELWGIGADVASGRLFFDLKIGLTQVDELTSAVRACATGVSRSEELTINVIDRQRRPLEIRVVCTPLAGPRSSGGVVLLMEALPSSQGGEPEVERVAEADTAGSS